MGSRKRTPTSRIISIRQREVSVHRWSVATAFDGPPQDALEGFQCCQGGLEALLCILGDFGDRRCIAQLDHGLWVKGLDGGDLCFWCSSEDRKSTRLNSSHVSISYAVFCLKKTTQASSSR